MSSRSWILICAALLAGLLVVGCNPNPQPAGLTPIPSLAPAATTTLVSNLQNPVGGVPPSGGQAAPGSAGRGVALFSINCATCHGGAGEGNIGPALRNNPFITTNDQAVFTVISGGRLPKMPAWLNTNGGPLTEADINSIIAYLHTLQGAPPLPSATPLPPVPTDTPEPENAPTEQPAVPSNPGEAGPAASMTGDVNNGKLLFGQSCAMCHGPEGLQGVPNPGSTDGTVPPLNPIDPTIASKDPKQFAANLDLFIEHGSTPEGSAPQILMPAFGERKIFTDQQIADLIAYVVSLNPQQ